MSPKDNEKKEEVDKTKKTRGLSYKSVWLVSGATVLSRILGLVRDMLFGSLFTRFQTDAFTVALTIPNVLRRFLAEGILSTAFIPVFTAYREKKEKDLKRVYGSVVVIFTGFLLGVTLLGELLAPQIVFLFASGFRGEKFKLAIFLVRVMFPFTFLVGMASFWTAILQTHRHFLTPALGPVFFNIGIITSALTLPQLFPPPYQITAMAVGVVIGGILQLILLIATARILWIEIAPHWNPKHPAIREIARLMLPTLFGLGIYQFNILLSRTFASWLPTGSVTYIYYSDRLVELPLGVIAVAFATVNLPALSSAAERKEWKTYIELLFKGLKGVLFFCLPAAIYLFFNRELIISLLFQRGLFSPTDVEKCAEVFTPAALAIVWIAIQKNLTPSFYALKDTKTPVLISGISFIINALLSLLLAFGLKLQALGLTAANAISALFSASLSFILLKKKVPHKLQIKDNFGWLASLLISGLAMALPLPFIAELHNWTEVGTVKKLLWTVISGSLSFGIFLLTSVLLKMPESQLLISKLNFAKKILQKIK